MERKFSHFVAGSTRQKLTFVIFAFFIMLLFVFAPPAHPAGEGFQGHPLDLFTQPIIFAASRV